MAGLPLLLALVVTALVGIGVAVVRRSPPSREGTVAGARRHAAGASVAAVAAGVLAALAVPFSDGSWGTGGPGSGGRELMLVPLTFGITHTVVLTIGELTWPRPAGQVRRARLVRRGPLDAAPPRLVRGGGGARRPRGWSGGGAGPSSWGCCPSSWGGSSRTTRAAASPGVESSGPG